jgi:glycosyltransferase involved in cell wall biosynthesis
MSRRAVTPRRIAIVSDSVFPYNTGGKETRIFELSTRLAAAGHDVHIYTMHWWNDASKTRHVSGVTFHAVSRFYPLYAGERRSTKQGILFGLACFKLIFENFDVVDVDHIPFFPLFSVRFVAALKRKPMVATWHEVWGKEYWQSYMGRQGLLAYFIEKLSILLPSKIIAVSEMTEQRLRAELNYKGASVLVRNGVDQTEIARVHASQVASDIIYAGRLIEHKHVDMLLKAVARLKVTRPDITCQIFGEGPDRPKLEALSLMLGLEENVTFFGFLPEHREIFAHMKASRVFVLPSTREGFGISVIEANACGLPVVTFNHPANAAKNLINNVTGRLSKVSSADLAKQIDILLTDSPSPDSVKAAIAEYDWKAASVSLQEAYTS